MPDQTPKGLPHCQTNPCDRWRTECQECALKDCPGGEPFHYHHDGCPYCTRLTLLQPLLKVTK